MAVLLLVTATRSALESKKEPRSLRQAKVDVLTWDEDVDALQSGPGLAPIVFRLPKDSGRFLTLISPRWLEVMQSLSLYTMTFSVAIGFIWKSNTGSWCYT